MIGGNILELYYGITAYQILVFILERFNKESDATLLISNVSTMANSTDLISNLLERGIFSRVEIIDDRELFVKTKNKKMSDEESFEVLTNHVDDQLRELEINISDIDSYNIAADHFPLGIYCMRNNIQYNFYEDAAGVYTNDFLLFDAMQFSNPLLYKLGNLSGCNGKSESAICKYLEYSAQSKVPFEVIDKAFYDIDIQKSIRTLSKKNKRILLSIYGLNGNIEIPPDTCMLFTKHFSNLNMMTLREQEELYSLIMDYFSDDLKLVIKKHPSDSQGCYSEMFPEAIILPRLFPSELLQLIINTKIERAITVSSTAIYNMSQSISKSLVFLDKTEKSYKMIHRYFVVNLLVELIGSRFEKLYHYGANQEFLLNFKKISNYKLQYTEIDSISESTMSSSILIFDQLSSENYTEQKSELISKIKSLNDKSIAIFINSEADFIFYEVGNEDILDDICTVEITHNAKKEQVYIYAKDSNIKELIGTLLVIKELKSSDKKINIHGNVKYEKNEMDIMLLVGYIKSLLTKFKCDPKTVFNIERNIRNHELMYECLKNQLYLENNKKKNAI